MVRLPLSSIPFHHLVFLITCPNYSSIFLIIIHLFVASYYLQDKRPKTQGFTNECSQSISFLLISIRDISLRLHIRPYGLLLLSTFFFSFSKYSYVKYLADCWSIFLHNVYVYCRVI